ncbi:MAG: polysaccharide deacetylase family protein [Oscillospiraceae bacterium]|jgi:peptidoglycan/xylan/chitin deacetylase (PgdA/CDA1 family)|nr:polysaccharide deacetylase family protein [Oscillospiraceae bacterium]
MRKKASAGFFYIINKWTALAFCVLFILGVLLATWEVGNIVKIVAQPEKKPIYSVDTEGMTVALGINCAWDNSDIPELLSILEHYNVKASFFVLGSWCDQYPESVRQIAGAGHEIGSHSNSHANLTRLDKEGVLSEIRESCRKIEELTGKAPALFRPPSGAYNSEVIGLIEEEGLYPIQWDCDLIHMKTLKEKLP